MTTFRIALLRGDGIGPEISEVALSVLNSLEDGFGIKFQFRESPAGDGCLREKGEALPKDSVETIQSSDACLKAPVGNTAADVIVKLRLMLKLYANIRPAKSLPNVESLRPDIDIVIVRENTEDLYRGMEFETTDGVVALRLITREASRRIAERAFRMAEGRAGKRKVVSVHKANVLRKSDGLFSQVCREVAARHQGIEFSDMLVDAAAMNLIRSPETFDVIVTTNLYGDILSDEAAQLVGGLGLAPSANIGDDYALFEPVHGSAPDIAGRGIANPTAIILSAAMMLEWLSDVKNEKSARDAAGALRSAVNAIIRKGVKTPDLGGRSTTVEMGAAMVRELGAAHR